MSETKKQSTMDFILDYQRQLRETADMLARRIGYTAIRGTEDQRAAEERAGRRAIERAADFDAFVGALKTANDDEGFREAIRGGRILAAKGEV